MTRNRITDIRTVKASELIPNPDNWRVHSTDQRAVMEHLLGTIGSVDVLKVVETAAGLMLLDGHLRADIAKDEDVQVAILDLDDAERDLVLATFDPVAAMAERSSDILASLTDRIGQDGIIGRLLEAVADAPSLKLAPVPEDPDDITEAVETVEAEGYEPTAKTGDVWSLGEHRIYCGDSLEPYPDGFMPAHTDMAFTDPPYNVKYRSKNDRPYEARARRIGAYGPPRYVEQGGSKFRDDIENDDVTPEQWAVFCLHVSHLLKDRTKGCVYVCHAPGPDGNVMRNALNETLHFSSLNVWVKNRANFGQAKYQNGYEPIWFGWTTSGTNFSSLRNLTNVWEFNRPSRNKEHPTMKPIELVEQAVSHASRPEQTVFDPFLGAGSTLLASERQGRTCYGIEIEPRYVDVTVARWESLTGEKATVQG